MLRLVPDVVAGIRVYSGQNTGVLHTYLLAARKL
jgi:hypothetical protein